MRRRARPGGGRQVEVAISAIGARGDGIAEVDGRPLFVPFTVPGDRVRARLTGERAGALKGEAVELIAEGPGRVEPPCPHFGPCGGCALQHLEDARYAAWKAGLLRQALRRRGLPDGDDIVRPMVRVPPGTRRRATLAAARRGGAVRLGFHGRESHAVVDLGTCLLLVPRLLGLLPGLREALAPVLPEGETAAVTVLETGEGPDVLIVSRASPDLAAREALAAFAAGDDLARLSWRERAGPHAGPHAAPGAEPIAIRRPPRLVFGAVPVEPPPGGFVQPTAAGEAALTAAVLAALPAGAARVADLYCGCGTFTFPLSKQMQVAVFEGDSDAVAALSAAANRAGLAGRVRAEVRDLARAPLTPEELAGFDCVVFDPPRLGAREQAAALAAAPVGAVVAVSCNPNTFARDARILADGGFALEAVTPVDQFPWSGHLELVAAFRRD